jgi:hypothetical protein
MAKQREYFKLQGKGWIMKRVTLTKFELVCLVLTAAGIGVIFLPAIRRIRSISPRMACGQNLVVLGEALLLYANDNDHKYPTPAEWCDLLIEQANVNEKQFKCPESKGARCSYAMNPNCDISSRPDIVLLFETEIWKDGGWNKFGGPELLTVRNHEGHGCNILHNGSFVSFESLHTLGSLRWGDEGKE